jgi:hypothetical protein
MLKHNAANFQALVERLMLLQTTATNFVAVDNYPPDYIFKPEEVPILLDEHLNPIKNILKEMELVASLLNSETITENLPTLTITAYRENIKTLRLVIYKELQTKVFLYIQKDKSDWFDKNTPFGKDVFEAFPSAFHDIYGASNCYALDCSTACVFHCMRVLEMGLHALANDFGIPFEITNWQNIINEIEKEIRSLAAAPNNTPRKQEKLQFSSEAAKEFTYFKDAWRNHVTHKHERYSPQDAEKIFNHTKDFMIHLSTKLKESNV